MASRGSNIHHGTLYPHGVLAWYVDGALYETQTGSNAGTNSTGWYNPGGSGTTSAAPFDKPFYFIMNIAVGGQYVGYNNPDTRPPIAAGSYTMTISDIEAFSLSVPEPSGFVLLTLGALALWRRKMMGGPIDSKALRFDRRVGI